MKFGIGSTSGKATLPEGTINTQQVGRYEYLCGDIQIDTLEQLLEICRNSGELILSCCGDDFHIEIYDDYRE